MIQITVNTYADLLALSPQTTFLRIRVLVDEDKGITNAYYILYPDGQRIWVATTEDN